MPATRFRMDPNQMEALSRELDGLYQSDFRAITRDLTQIDRALESAWTGAARQAFQSQFGGWVRAAEPLGHSLVAVAHFLREAAAEYRRLDADLAQRDLVDPHHRLHPGRTTAPPPDWRAFLASLPTWPIAILNTLVDLWQRGLPSPFVRLVGGGGTGASASAVAIDLPDWLQAIIDFFTGGNSDDPIPEPQVNNLGDDGCVMTDQDGNVLYSLFCSPPVFQAEPSFLQWLWGSAPVAVPGGPIVDAPIVVPGQDPNNDEDERSSGGASGGTGPRGGGSGGDDILDDITRPTAGNGNRIPETIDEARVRVGNERFDALAWDPDRGQFSEQEAQVGLDLEQRGVLTGPIMRGSSGADFIDAQGRGWDVKQFNSHYPPQSGGFDVEVDSGKIAAEIGRNEYVVVDTRNLTVSDTLLLQTRIRDLGLDPYVIWWP